jgi:SAM-dependent methyltransferase
MPGTSESKAALTFAHVYDALYGYNERLQGQADFLAAVFGPPGATSLLDAGCGTGSHVQALTRRGYRVVGLDIDRDMIDAARRKLPGGELLRADLARLPFGQAFGGILCLESPLAYLHHDAKLGQALDEFHRVLHEGAAVVIDVFDYLGTLGAGRVRTRQAIYPAPKLQVHVQEAHRYDARTGLWTMRQRFTVDEGSVSDAFEVRHQLRVRTADEYARALERAGFTIIEVLADYPSRGAAPSGSRLWRERRMIFVARR